MENVAKAYSYLWALNSSLVHEKSDDIIHDGSWAIFNQYMDELAKALSDDSFLGYKVAVSTFQGWGEGVRPEEMRRKVRGATSYLFMQYHDHIESDSNIVREPEGASTPTSESRPSTVVNQTQSNDQRTEVNVEFNQTLIGLTELLTNARTEFSDPKSKENKFITALTKSMSMAKTSLELITLIITTAQRFGIGFEQLHQIFK